MSEWKEYKLGEIASFQTGKLNSNEAVENGLYPFFTCSPITLRINTYAYDQKAILLAGNNAEGNFSIKYYEGKFNAYQRTYIIKSNEEVGDLKFLFYSLILCLQEFKNISQGTSTRFLTSAILNNLVISLPPLDEQKRIAGVLSSLDDKIDLLNRENATLEALAETLFRHYFIENPNPTWKEGKLGDYVDIKRGGSPRPITDYLAPSGYRWLKISDVTNIDSPYIFHTKEYIKESGLKKTVLLNEGSLVLSNSATPGIPKILCVDSCIHDGWLYFPKSRFSKYYLYLFFKYIRQDLINLGNGSIFTNLKTDILKNYVINIPNSNSLDKFESIVRPLFEKMLDNTKQIIILETQRDTLLHTLMTGEVKLKDNKL